MRATRTIEVHHFIFLRLVNSGAFDLPPEEADLGTNEIYNYCRMRNPMHGLLIGTRRESCDKNGHFKRFWG